MAVAYSDEGGGGADHPGGGLHGGSGEARTSPGESNPREGTDKDRDDVDKAEDAMELEMTLADPLGEINRADEESEDSGECMREEESTVGNHLQPVGVVHGVIGDEENF